MTGTPRVGVFLFILFFWVAALTHSVMGQDVAEPGREDADEEPVLELVRTDIEIGWEPGVARARLPGWLPFYIRLQNDQEVLVRGRMVIEGLMSASHAYGALALQYEVELAPGSIKAFHDALYAQKNVRYVRIRIDWTEGVEGKYEKTFPLVLSGPDTKLVLHSSPDTVPGQWMRTAEKGLSLLERIVVPGALRDLDRVPRRWQEYGGVDIIFLEGESWSGWSEEQIAALRQWVIQGGHLMVAPGSSWPAENARVLRGLLPAQYGTAAVLPAGAEVFFLPRETVAPWRAGNGVGYYRLAPDPGFYGEAIRSWLFPDRSVALVTARVGMGRSSQWAFSPSLGGIAQWVGGRLLLHVLMGNEVQPALDPSRVGQAGTFLLWAKGNALALLPSRDRVGLLLVVYLGLVLPILYFLCRIAGRRVIFWAVLPLLSIGLGLLFLRRAPPSELAVRELKIRQGTAGGRRLWERTMVHVQSPLPDAYHVHSSGGMAVPVRVWPAVDETDEEEPPLPDEQWVTRTEGRDGTTEGMKVGANDSVTFFVAGSDSDGDQVPTGLVWDQASGWVLRMDEAAGNWMLLAYGNRVWPARPGPLGGGWSLEVGGPPAGWPAPVQELADLIKGAMPLKQPAIYRWSVPAAESENAGERTSPAWEVTLAKGGGRLPARVERRVLEGRDLHPRGMIGQAITLDDWEVELYLQTGRTGSEPVSPYRTVSLGLWDGIIQVTPRDLPPGIPVFLSLDLTVRIGDSGQAASVPDVEIYDIANDRWVVLTERVINQLAADPTPALHPLRGVFWIRVPGRGFPLELEILTGRLEARVWAE
jgi:hypothetical protein